MGDTKVPLSQVLDGIAAAAEAGLAPVKLNTVLRRGMNEAGLLDLVEFARDGGYVLRFIEYMDVGNTNGWDRSEVVASAEVLDRVAAVHPVEPVAAGRPGEVAQRWRYLDGRGELGLISSVSMPFCGTCTRARLTAIGELYTCLFATHGRDLRGLLRGGVDDEALHDGDRRYLGRSGRPLLRAAGAGHCGPPEARNVLPRRLIPHLSADAVTTAMLLANCVSSNTSAPRLAGYGEYRRQWTPVAGPRSAADATSAATPSPPSRPPGLCSTTRPDSASPTAARRWAADRTSAVARPAQHPTRHEPTRLAGSRGRFSSRLPRIRTWPLGSSGSCHR